MKISFLHSSLLTKQAVVGLVVMLCAVLLPMFPANAEDESQCDVEVPKLAKKPAKLDAGVEASLDHLFALLGDKSVSLDNSKLEAMLNMVANSSEDPKDIAPAGRFDGKGICLRHNLGSDLEGLMKYFYNKDIPSFLLSPATLRYSNWYKGSDFLNRTSPLWDELENLDQPVLTRGREFEACTPDSFGEAYFSYDVDRLIILLKYQGKNVLVSVSKQDGQSDVGRKGAILNDREWNYFYSGIEGINRGLIGWMDTFMYNSGSVVVFVEQDKAAKQTSMFLFKWLKAGWSGMNVVKRQHIYAGTMRYSRSMSKVLESPVVTPEEMALGMSQVKSLTQPQVDLLIDQYAKNFEARFKNEPKLKKKSYAKLIVDGGYSEVMDERARRYTVYLEKLKSMLGMETLIDVGSATAAN